MMQLGTKIDVRGKWMGQINKNETHTDGVHVVSESTEKRTIYKLKAKMASLSSSHKVTKISDMEYIVE